MDMRRSELIRQIRALGWSLLRQGGNHEIWAHPAMTHHLVVPRHNWINPNTAREILRRAQGR